MKVAITTASGQLGHASLEQLIALIGKENCIAIARTPAKVKIEGVEVRQGDYSDADHWPMALAGVDAVLLISATGDPAARIQQHRNVIEGAKKAGVKRIVYTSVLGPDDGSHFSGVVRSNRQTEQDVMDSGLEWAISRNGIYIEPDIEYINQYKADGKIANSAGDQKCAYTHRSELGYAYARLLTNAVINQKVYQLCGTPISQAELANYLNKAFSTSLVYEPMSVAAYQEERIAALGEFLGTIIAGIYEAINSGAFDVSSDYEEAAGRPHIGWESFFGALASKA